MIVEEYEKTISEVISEREREKIVHEIEKDKLAGQRDHVIEDLKSVERAFNDVHRCVRRSESNKKTFPFLSTHVLSSLSRKYERTKEVISDFKANEDALKSNVNTLTIKLKKSEEKFELLRTHAESKLDE